MKKVLICFVSFAVIAMLGSCQLNDDQQKVIQSDQLSVLVVSQAVIVSAVASTTNGGNTPANSFDGNTGTRWESVHAVDPQWIYWDLGASQSLNQIVIDWNSSAASNYTIEGSADASSWNILATVVNTAKNDNNYITNAISGSYRYIRMNGTTRNGIYGYSIREVWISINVASSSSSSAPSSSSSSLVSSSSLSSAVSSSSSSMISSSTSSAPVSSAGSILLSQGKPATASSFQAGNDITNANDGSLTTRWTAGAATFPQWWSVDLQQSGCNLTSVIISWYASATRYYKYKIEVSADNSNWILAVDKTANTNMGDSTNNFSATGRYVKVTVTGTSAGWASAYEIKVYGTPGNPVSSASSAISSSSSSYSGVILPPVNSGMLITFQVTNITHGKWADNQIYITCQCRFNNQFCNLAPDGTLTPCVSGDNTSNHSYLASAYPTWQMPANVGSGRLYVSYGKPLCASFNGTPPNVGIAYPNPENGTDPNNNTYFDWIEFALGANDIWVNTTQVDILGFPMTVALYRGTGTSYTLNRIVGMTNSFDWIHTAWSNQMNSTWDTLCYPMRMMAPIHNPSVFSNYFDTYISDTWNYYTASNMIISSGGNTYVGCVLPGTNRLVFTNTKPTDTNKYYIDRPKTFDVIGGAGALARRSVENGTNSAGGTELGLEAQVCAAFHRGVVMDVTLWNSPSAYYQNSIHDNWSAFMHSISLPSMPGDVHPDNNRCYGFCYDDVNDCSSTCSCDTPRGIVLSLYW